MEEGEQFVGWKIFAFVGMGPARLNRADRIGLGVWTAGKTGVGPGDSSFATGACNESGTAEVLPGDVFEAVVHGIAGFIG